MSKTINIQSLFPDCVAAECSRITEDDYELYPEERGLIQKAIPKRQREFAAGRSCARRALKRLGIKECALTKKPDRSIAWPEGVVGSISHNHPWCGAAVARQKDLVGIGFDIETVQRVNQNIWRHILTDQENDWVAVFPEHEAQRWAALIFSAKESVYKCVHPLLKTRIWFKDAVIVPNTEKSYFDVSLNEKISIQLPSCLSLTGQYFYHENAVFTGVVLKQ